MLVVDTQPIHRPRRCTAPGCCAGAGRCGPCIPTEVRRRGRILMNQQCWLWGQDIRRPEGNALIAHGFARTKPPEGLRGSNTYLLQRPGGATILLWAFGFFYHLADQGGVYIPRFAATPRLARFDGLPGEVWSATQLGECRPPRGTWQWARARQLFVPALRWLAEYERWVRAERGLDYRRACVRSWKHAQTPAETLDAQWEALADDCDAAIGAFIAARA